MFVVCKKYNHIHIEKSIFSGTIYTTRILLLLFFTMSNGLIIAYYMARVQLKFLFFFETASGSIELYCDSLFSLTPINWGCYGNQYLKFMMVTWGISLPLQYGNYQHRMAVEDLNKRWQQVILSTSVPTFSLVFYFLEIWFYQVNPVQSLGIFKQPMTPLEHCEWLNKLLMEIWSNFMNPKLSLRFQSIVEVRIL